MRNAAAGGDVDAEHADCDHVGGGEAVDDMRCVSPTVKSFEHRTSEVRLALGADVEVAAQQGGRLIAVLFMEHLGHRPRCNCHAPQRNHCAEIAGVLWLSPQSNRTVHAISRPYFRWLPLTAIRQFTLVPLS
nr:hypothetical protein [Williamsia marianensis]